MESAPTERKPITVIEAGRYVLDTIQRYRLGDFGPGEYRMAMAYIRSRTSEADYEAAKMWAAARDPQ